MCLAGLPVLNGIAPTVEAVTESLINMTPLKPSPEEVRQTRRSLQNVHHRLRCFSCRKRSDFVGGLRCNSGVSMVACTKPPKKNGVHARGFF